MTATLGTRPSNRNRWLIAAGVIGVAVLAGLFANPFGRDPKPTDSVSSTSPQRPFPNLTTDRSSDALPTKFTNSIGMKFVLVPKGKAWLGGGGGVPGNKEVEFKDDFYLGVYEVTQEKWEKGTGLTPGTFSRTGPGKDAVKDIPDAELKRFPVEMVSWVDAQLFLERLNKQEKEAGWIYRLPRADEWEYACRGSPLSDTLNSAFHFYFNKPTNQLLPEQANFNHGQGLKRTCKAGSYNPNRLGLYDMHGNVMEWCDDEEKHATVGSCREVRSGGWGEVSVYSNWGMLVQPAVVEAHLGLRVARLQDRMGLRRGRAATGVAVKDSSLRFRANGPSIPIANPRPFGPS